MRAVLGWVAVRLWGLGNLIHRFASWIAEIGDVCMWNSVKSASEPLACIPDSGVPADDGRPPSGETLDPPLRVVSVVEDRPAPSNVPEDVGPAPPVLH